MTKLTDEQIRIHILETMTRDLENGLISDQQQDQISLYLDDMFKMPEKPMFDIKTIVEKGILTQEELAGAIDTECSMINECVDDYAYANVETEINSATSVEDLRERLFPFDEEDED